MAIAAENSKAKQDTEKKSQEVWNEAKAKHEAASNAADVAFTHGFFQQMSCIKSATTN